MYGLWGAPRTHGELLGLGIEVAQSTVAKYMIKHPRATMPMASLPPICLSCPQSIHPAHLSNQIADLPGIGGRPPLDPDFHAKRP